MKTNRNKMKKLAFTMAELLIAMTILGVVAALMLRTVNRINPDKDKQLFLRSFHAIEAAAGEVVNDTSFYDPDVNEISDLSTDPLPITRIELYAKNSPYGEICATKSKYTNCYRTISKNNAICYLIASKMNVNGITDCTGGKNIMNFKLGNGTCVYGLAGSIAPFEFVIDPSCKGIEYGYAAKIFPSGSMTVPETSESYANEFKKVDENAQKKAYTWMYAQTDVKKRDYDFEKEGN